MKFVPMSIPDVVLVEPRVFGDARGFFFESWNARSLAEAGIDARFVQDSVWPGIFGYGLCVLAE